MRGMSTLAVLAAPLLVLLLLVALAGQGSAQTLKFAQIVFRHGDRSALQTVPAFGPESNVWPDGLGQLTTIGMMQHYHVGKFFAKRYESFFVNATYHPTLMNILSTDLDRTLMSAQSQLAGWFEYPNSPFNFSWQPIPVHTVPQSMDSLLLPFDGGKCARYVQLQAQHAKLPARAAKEAELASDGACQGVGLPVNCTNLQFVTRLGNLSGIPNYSFDNLWMLTDTMLCRRDHPEVPQPTQAWARDNEVFYQLLGLENFTMYEEFTGQEERRLSGGPLVKQMIQNMQVQASASATAQKVQLYSAHDTTVAAFLEALNTDHFRAGSPPYATAVQVELYEMPDSSYSVLIILKNESVSDPYAYGYNLTVPGCATLCPLDQFIKLQYAAGIIPDNWSAECMVSSSPSSSSPSKKLVPLWIGVSMIVVAIVGLVYWYKTRKTSRHHRLLNDGRPSEDDEE